MTSLFSLNVGPNSHRKRVVLLTVLVFIALC